MNRVANKEWAGQARECPWCGKGLRLLTYLAAPYTHLDQDVVYDRYRSIVRATADMLNQGVDLFSPIAHTHDASIAGGLPLDPEWWKKVNECYLLLSERVLVLKLDGWQESRGVRWEIQYAKDNGLDLRFLDAEKYRC